MTALHNPERRNRAGTPASRREGFPRVVCRYAFGQWEAYQPETGRVVATSATERAAKDKAMSILLEERRERLAAETAEAVEEA